jgi:hypothetical protein
MTFYDLSVLICNNFPHNLLMTDEEGINKKMTNKSLPIGIVLGTT